MADLIVDGASNAPVASPLAGQLASDAPTDTTSYGNYGDAPVEGDSLEVLRALAQELVNCQADLAKAMLGVVDATKALADVQEKRLPELMEKHDLKNFTFVDKRTGLTRIIEFVEKWASALPPKQGKTMDPMWKEKRGAIYKWLREIGKGGLIKKDLTAPLGLFSDEDTQKIVAQFKELCPGVEIDVEEKVEPASLTALIAKMKDEGKNVHEFIKVTPVREARVKGK